jgi:hypothetical protein
VTKVINVTERFQLPPLATGSTWSAVYWSLWETAKKRRGTATSEDGTFVPRLTNREAVALVEAWRAVSPLQSAREFTLAYQFEAVAWGWDPASDMFDVSTKQADKLYSIEASRDLWVMLKWIATALDEAKLANVPPRVELDATAFADLLVQGDVRRKLIEDGGVVAFKSPLVEIIREGMKNPITPEQQKKLDDAVKKARNILPKRPQEIAKDATSFLKLLALGAAAFVIYRNVRRRPARRRIPRRTSARRFLS